MILGVRMLPDSEPRRGGQARRRSASSCSSTSMPLIVYGLSEIGDPGKLHRADRGLADRRRPGAARRPSAGTRCAPTRPLLDVRLYANRDLRRRLADHLRPRRGALRGDDPGAALLPAGARRERHRHRPAGRPAGARDARSSPPSPPASPTASAAAASPLVGVSILCLSSLPFAFIGADTSILCISLAAAASAASASASPSSRPRPSPSPRCAPTSSPTRRRR